MKNSITDVPGVSVGHLTVDAGEVQTGVSVIAPYPLSIRDRKLFIGSFASGDRQSWTGLQVAADFGTFSSPIVLCNSTTVGIAYDAMISYGHQRAEDLPTDNGWPPLVIGIDDGYVNDLRQRTISHDAILDLVKAVEDKPMVCGSVGIGRGLCALGGKGGIGDASRIVQIGDEEVVVGVMVAANGGRLADQKDANMHRSLTPSMVLIVATSAALLPEGLSALAAACMRRLDALITWEVEDQQLALAFSTSNTIDQAFEDEFHLKPVRQYFHAHLDEILQAGAEAAGAAFLRALTDAEAVKGRKGRLLQPIGIEKLKWIEDKSHGVGK